MGPIFKRLIEKSHRIYKITGTALISESTMLQEIRF